MTLCVLLSVHDTLCSAVGTWHFVFCSPYMTLCVLLSVHDTLCSAVSTWHFVFCCQYMTLCVLLSVYDTLCSAVSIWHFVFCCQYMTLCVLLSVHCVWMFSTVYTTNLISQKPCVVLLGTYAKLWKVTISFVMSVHPSICMVQLGSHWTDFNEIWYLSVLWKSAKKIHVSLKSGKNNGYFTWRPM